MSHRIAYGGGAQVVRSVPMRDGRAVVVASADFEVLDLRYSDESAEHVLASGSATVDSVSTTLAADAGKGTADPRSLTVASATGIVAGRRYVVKSGGKESTVKVEAVSGTTLRLASALPSLFASGSSFLGVELVATVPSDVAADDDYLGAAVLAVRWEPSGLLPYQEQIFVERVAPVAPLSPDGVLTLDPTLASYAGQAMTAEDALAMALEDFRVDLMLAGIDDTAIMGGALATSAVRYRAAYHLLKHSSDESAVRRVEAYGKRYDEIRAALAAGLDKPKVTHVDPQDDTAKARTVRGLFRAGGW